jgi:hypothetical protein
MKIRVEGNGKCTKDWRKLAKEVEDKQVKISSLECKQRENEVLIKHMRSEIDSLHLEKQNVP